MLRKKTISFVLLFTLILNTLGVSSSYAIEPTGSIELSLDKTNPNVGEVITATLSIKDIQNFAGYEVNIKYDKDVLAPIRSNGYDYTNSTMPDAGTLLCKEEYSQLGHSKNDLKNGRLCFAKFYLHLEAYQASGKPETTGSLAVVYFKVLKKAPTRILMLNAVDMPNSIDGTVLFDWYGERINEYSVYQANEINPLPVRGQMDSPLNNQIISAKSVSVYGWFLDPYGVSKIEVLVDGNVIGTAVYGYPRSDVAKAFPDYNNFNSGFCYNLNTASLSEGVHTIQIKETGSTGNVSWSNLRRFTVRKAMGFIDSPSQTASALSGTYNVVGWFGDTTGIANVSVLIDGVKVGDAIYGLSRSDVPKVYPYFNSTTGYNYKLNTLNISNGTHTISVVETGTNGDQTIIPPRTITVLN